jgi:hypothetical protein
MPFAESKRKHTGQDQWRKPSPKAQAESEECPKQGTRAQGKAQRPKAKHKNPKQSTKTQNKVQRPEAWHKGPKRGTMAARSEKTKGRECQKPESQEGQEENFPQGESCSPKFEWGASSKGILASKMRPKPRS